MPVIAWAVVAGSSSKTYATGPSPSFSMRRKWGIPASDREGEIGNVTCSIRKVGSQTSDPRSRHRFVIGSRRSRPNAFREIFVPGGY
jgi:hypothetical protein